MPPSTPWSRHKVPFFGSGSDEAVAMANRVARFAHDTYGAHRNFRGGPYTTGFWSMSNHVAFGTLSGALPTGRLNGKAFTPGLTPEPNASKNLLDNIRDVARLDPHNMNNNIAFNVKVVPGASDSHEQVVERMYSYVKTYFDLGGMQMQMNVVTSEMLRDAMAHPENYRNLLVRISGYNAYFVTLNRDMQIELIERAEYRHSVRDFSRGAPSPASGATILEGKRTVREIAFDAKACVGCDTCMNLCPKRRPARGNRHFIDRTRCSLLLPLRRRLPLRSPQPGRQGDGGRRNCAHGDEGQTVLRRFRRRRHPFGRRTGAFHGLHRRAALAPGRRGYTPCWKPAAPSTWGNSGRSYCRISMRSISTSS